MPKRCHGSVQHIYALKMLAFLLCLAQSGSAQKCPEGSVINGTTGPAPCRNVCQIHLSVGESWDADQVANLAHAHKFRCQGLLNAVAEAGAESGDDAPPFNFHPFLQDANVDSQTFRVCSANHIKGGSVDRGLWQINSAWNPGCDADTCALQPDTAADYVYRVTGGGYNWIPIWKATFGGVRFQAYLQSDAVKKAVNQFSDDCTDTPPVSGGPAMVAFLNTEDFFANDPNDKVGSIGNGNSQYVSGASPLRYAIFFSNEQTASAPASKVVISDQLDVNNLQIQNLTVGPVVFGDQLFNPAALPQAFSTVVDLRPQSNLLVKIEAALDTASGMLTWHFTSLDPVTNQPPLDPTAGFLPPGGEGSVFFAVMPKAGLPTNTQINNQAMIVFDANAPIPTQTWLNTIDNDKPLSHVLALPTQSSASIPLQWTGTDVGAGVQDFTIFVSDNGGPFASFLTNTTSTSITFPGQIGHNYGFLSRARDLVGNVEDLKTRAEATTTIPSDLIPPTTVAVLAPPPNVNGWNNSNVTVNLSSTDNPGGSGVQQITFSATGAQPIPATIIPAATASSTISIEGITNLIFFASDLAGNVEQAHTLTVELDKTPPTITPSSAPAANTNDWNKSNVTVSFACADSLSGLAPGSPPAATLVSSEG